MFTDLMVGRLALWFWMFAVVGGLIPLLLVALPWTRNVRGMVIASCLVLPMMWLKRVLLVVGPATYDTITSTFCTYHFTWVPIAITLAATAAVPLLLMLLFRVVPLLSIDEIEEIEEMRELGDPDDQVSARPRTTASEPAPDEDELVGAGGPPRSRGDRRPAARRPPRNGRHRHSQHRQGRDPAERIIECVSGEIDECDAQNHGRRRRSGWVDGAQCNNSWPRWPSAVRCRGWLPISTTQFGPARLVSLGSATTDKTGIARLTLGGDVGHLYQPTANGPQEFVATYAAAGAQPVTSSTTVNVTVARSAYKPAPPKPLADVGSVLVIVLFAIVAAIWLTLLAQVWRIRRVCRELPEPTTILALTPFRGHLVREDVHYGTHTSGVHP